MAGAKYVADSEGSPDPLDIIQTSKRKRIKKSPSVPTSTLSHRFRGSVGILEDKQSKRTSTSGGKKIAVMVKGPARPWEYLSFDADRTVDEVLAEIDQPGGEVWYRIEYGDGRREDVSTRGLYFVSEICAHCLCGLF